MTTTHTPEQPDPLIPLKAAAEAAGFHVLRGTGRGHVGLVLSRRDLPRDVSVVVAITQSGPQIVSTTDHLGKLQRAVKRFIRDYTA